MSSFQNTHHGRNPATPIQFTAYSIQESLVCPEIAEALLSICFVKGHDFSRVDKLNKINGL
jgi:hypothetical protein